LLRQIGRARTAADSTDCLIFEHILRGGAKGGWLLPFRIKTMALVESGIARSGDGGD